MGAITEVKVNNKLLYVVENTGENTVETNHIGDILNKIPANVGIDIKVRTKRNLEEEILQTINTARRNKRNIILAVSKKFAEFSEYKYEDLVAFYDGRDVWVDSNKIQRENIHELTYGKTKYITK